MTLNRTGDVPAVMAHYHIAPGAHADTAAMALLADILTSAPGGRLYRAWSRRQGIGAGRHPARAQDPGSAIFVAVAGKDKRWRRRARPCWPELEGFAARPVTAEELERCPHAAAERLRRDPERPAAYGLALSEAIARATGACS